MFENLLAFFVTSAHAAPDAIPLPPPPPGAGGFQLTIMLFLLIFFFYFIVWRPQNKRTKEHRDLLSSLAKGDEVVTTGGILGKVNKLTDGYIVLSVSDTVELTIQKSSIATVLPKGTLKSI